MSDEKLGGELARNGSVPCGEMVGVWRRVCCWRLEGRTLE